MPFRVTCTTCGTHFALTDDLYERKIKNRIVTIRCKSCSSDISVDGEALAANAATASATANEPMIDSDSLPASTKPPDLTPTVPLQSALERAADAQQTPTPALPSKTKTEGLWVVCCPDEDDRELTLPEIEQAIAKNEVNGDAIVWRDGMAEWLPIHQVPELRLLLKKPPLPKPKGRTLLGIGVKPSSSATATPKPPIPKPPAPPVSDPDNEPVSVEPEPLSESSAELLAKRKGGAVALSPGLLSVKRVEEGARPEPPPRRRQDSIPEPPPRPKLDSIPDPPPRPKLDSKPDAPARPRMDSKPEGIRVPPKPPTPVRPVTKLLLEERGADSAPDSSGTPNLRALASVVPKKSGRPDEEKKPEADVFMWGGPSDTELLGAPTIDVAGLSGPPAAGPTAKSETPPSSTGKNKKKSRRPKAPDEPLAERAVESAPAEALSSKPEPEKKSGTGLFVLIAAAVLLGGGFLLVRGKGTTETPPEPVATPIAAAPPPAPTTEPAATLPGPAEPVPAPTSEAQNPAPPATAEQPAPSKPAEPKASPGTERPVRETTPAEPKPAPGETAANAAAAEKPAVGTKPAASAAAEKPAEAAPAAEFDRVAASAALNTAAAQASACRKEGDPTGAAAVVVTFAPSGRVTSANVNGPPFAGTATGGCIAAAMRRAKVPPFSGAHVTVGKTVPIR
jgi:hypothetical protein